MDKRMVDFIRTLRAAGVRISLAESIDAMHGVDEVGVGERELVPRRHEDHPRQRSQRSR